jgi:LacI family transcriptional regulator
VKKVTLNDIAKKVGVSKTLVSLVVNGKARGYGISGQTCDKVMAAVRAYGYNPNQTARSLRTGMSNTLGLIVSDISNNFYASLARQLEDLAWELGYNMIIGSTDESVGKELKLLEIFRNRQVDGIILSSSQQNPTELETLVKSGFPLVLIDRYFPTVPIPSAVVNNKVGGELLAQHLLNQGFRNPVVLSLTPSYISSVAERVEGFVSVFENAAIHTEVHNIPFLCLVDMVEDFFTTRLHDKNMPDAVFAVNNNLATATLRACHVHNIVIPKDIALVCFDELPYFDFSKPSITSIRQPVAELCSVAFSLLLGQITNNGETKPGHVEMMPVELLVRESSTQISDNNGWRSP